MRALGAEEAALWARVTATIRPLSREPAGAVNSGEITPEPAAPPARQVRATPAPRALPSPLARRPAPHSSATLDGSWDKKLRNGSISPDRVLDLHGHNLEGAWQAIDRELERAVAAGDRVVLLVTGHERPGEPPVIRGRIRAAVQDWLAVSRHARRIAAVRAAHRRHGGGGSLYLILRRQG